MLLSIHQVNKRILRLRKGFCYFSSDFKRIGVVGLGLMGHGVAQVTAQAGYQVLAIETSQAAVDAGMKRIEGSLGKVISRDVSKGKYSEADGKKAYEEIMARITPTTKLTDAKDCDLIIEAIAENMDLKLQFYKNLGPIINNECTFASNTSSLQITAMAVASGRPDKFIGLHFFNPVQIMKLLEVIKTEHTSPAVFDKVVSFGKKIGKTTVSCGDTPGFIVNRLLVPYLAQAMLMVDRRVASVPDIDVSMQLGAGHPMVTDNQAIPIYYIAIHRVFSNFCNDTSFFLSQGPLHLADYIGLDTCLSILVGWKKDFPNEPSFMIPACLEKLVKAGNIGRKSGSGFYKWDGDKVGVPIV